MKNLIFNYDEQKMPGSYVFIRVTGEDGDFYDLVTKEISKKHIAQLVDRGYNAVAVKNRKNVPPCKFRDFTDDLPHQYKDAIWRQGIDFYIVPGTLAPAPAIIITGLQGSDAGTIRVYTGKMSDRAMKLRLAKERDGWSWAKIWIYDYTNELGPVYHNFDEPSEQRHIPASAITD